MNIVTSKTREVARRFPEWPYAVDPDSVQAQGLVGWWPGDPAGGGRLYDQSGYGNHGTLTNGPAWAVDRYGNRALRFDGTNDYAALPGGGSLDLAGDLAFSCLCNPVSVGGEVFLYGGYLNGGAFNGWGVRHSNGNGNVFQFWDGAAWRLSSDPLTAGAWQRATVTATGSLASFYLDGESAGTAACSARPSYAGAKALASVSDGSLPTAVSLADVRLYRVALPAAVVWQIYDRPAALAYPLGRRVVG